MNGNVKLIWNRGEKRRKSQAAVPISIWKRKSCFFFWKGPEEKKSCQIKERELQNKLKNNTGSRTCRQKNRDFLAEEQEEVEKRLRKTERFFKEHHVVLKACVLCELKMVDKILIYPDHLKVVKKQGKCIIAAETLDMLY